MRKPIASAIFAALVAGGVLPITAAHAVPSAQPASSYAKVLAQRGSFHPGDAGVELLQDYGGFALYRVEATTLSAVASPSKMIRVEGEADILQFTAQPFDTQRDHPIVPAPFSAAAPAGPGLQVVQFVGPVRQAWLDALAARGIIPVHYVASNGYVVWADDTAQARLADLRSSATWLQYNAPLQGFLKVDPALGSRLAADPASGDEVDIVVQIYTHPGVASTRQFVQDKGVLPVAQQAPFGAGSTNYAWAPILAFENLALRVRLADVPAIAERTDVTFIGARLPAELADEKQALILSGDTMPGPASPSYLQFLLDHGFSQDPGSYPLIDITDSTIDEGGTGTTVLDTIDAMLHVRGDLAQQVRVNYFRNCSTRSDSAVGAADGHGSLNAGIIAGYDQRTGYPFQDSDGKQLGLGINPFARIGSTTIFVGSPTSFDIGGCEGNDQGVVRANAANGARISSNSWGYGASSTYTDHDQIYDAAVRDVDVEAAGNQPMIYVVAAANDGPGASTVGSPGSGKNVITVGASENLRPFTSAGSQCLNDGADAGDDPQSIAGFSSRGPVAGNRVKPEVVAPGTHVLAGASVYSGYQGGGVCIKYYPESPSQTVFASSSGTSHATPAVSGVASLAYWWIEHGGVGAAAHTLDEIGGARAPSPALMKAWLMAHPNYLTGTGANDDLPSNSQGYGMPNMGDMFNAMPKVLLDQSDTFDNTGETRNYSWGIADPDRPVRIALAYTDAPGALGTSPQVNDLDLRVEAGGRTYLGNHFEHQWSATGGTADNRNNYEAVFLPPGTLGDLTITVVAANIAGDGVPGSGDMTDQDFALVCSNCTQQPTFTLTVPSPSLQVCIGDAGSTVVHLDPVLGFVAPITLGLTGNPGGTVADFAPNPTMAPASPTLTVSAAPAVTPGRYPMIVTATSGSIIKALDMELGLFDAAPGLPADETPVDGARDVSPTPTFAWTAAADAYGYLVQVASDPEFTNIVRTHETIDTSWTIGSGDSLDTSTRYWWRVIARNPCGDDGAAGPSVDTVFANGFDAVATLPGRVFTTLALPGDCPVDTSATLVFSDDMESGATGWTHGAAAGSTDGWTLGDQANSGTHAWQAGAPVSGTPNDQWLVSPVIALPSGLAPLSLKFWNRQNLKAGDAGICNDGAIGEISANGGSTWTQLVSVLTDPFDGVVSAAFGNPLAGKQGWCGDPQPYVNSVVDLQGYAGQAVRFRFRIGHDRFPHRSGASWAIDDVKVTGCSP